MGLVWSLASLNVFAKPLIDSIAEASRQKIHQLSAQFITNMAWACANFEYHHRPLFDAIAEAAITKL